MEKNHSTSDNFRNCKICRQLIGIYGYNNLLKCHICGHICGHLYFNSDECICGEHDKEEYDPMKELN